MEIKSKTIAVSASERVITESMGAPWNFREDAELVYSLSGSIRVIAPDGFQAFSLNEGQGVFITPKTMNRILSATREATVISIYFSPSILWQDTASVVYSNIIMPLMSNQEGLISLSSNSAQNIYKVYRVMEQKEYGYEIEVRDILSEIILFLIRELGRAGVKSLELRNERLYRMVNYIKKNYRENISLKDIAESGVISEREALRTFSKSLGQSPVQFLISFRLSEGAKLLETSDYNIDQIASFIGFESSSHFSKLFKRSYSLTPTQYRLWFRKA